LVSFAGHNRLTAHDSISQSRKRTKSRLGGLSMIGVDNYRIPNVTDKHNKLDL